MPASVPKKRPPTGDGESHWVEECNPASSPATLTEWPMATEQGGAGSMSHSGLTTELLHVLLPSTATAMASVSERVG